MVEGSSPVTIPLASSDSDDQFDFNCDKPSISCDQWMVFTEDEVGDCKKQFLNEPREPICDKPHWIDHTYDFENTLCYQCSFISRLIKRYATISNEEITRRFNNQIYPENIALFVEYLPLGLLMFYGKKFNQLSYRLWGLLFILIAN